MTIVKALRKADADGKGLIGASEFRAVLSSQGINQGVNVILKQYQEKQDGRVNYVKFLDDIKAWNPSSPKPVPETNRMKREKIAVAKNEEVYRDRLSPQLKKLEGRIKSPSIADEGQNSTGGKLVSYDALKAALDSSGIAVRSPLVRKWLNQSSTGTAGEVDVDKFLQSAKPHTPRAGMVNAMPSEQPDTDELASRRRMGRKVVNNLSVLEKTPLSPGQRALGRQLYGKQSSVFQHLQNLDKSHSGTLSAYETMLALKECGVTLNKEEMASALTGARTADGRVAYRDLLKKAVVPNLHATSLFELSEQPQLPSEYVPHSQKKRYDDEIRGTITNTDIIDLTNHPAGNQDLLGGVHKGHVRENINVSKEPFRVHSKEAASETEREVSKLKQELMDKVYGSSQRIKDVFRKFDGNHSNAVDYTEFSTAIASLNLKTSEDAKRALFSEIDQDRSGTLDLNEFVNVLKYDDVQRSSNFMDLTSPISRREFFGGSKAHSDRRKEFDGNTDIFGAGSTPQRYLPKAEGLRANPLGNAASEDAALDEPHVVQERKHARRVREEIVRKVERKTGNFREVFHQFDTNRDGAIDINELRDGLKNMGLALKDHEIESVFKMVDKNGDGTIDYGELAEALRFDDMQSADPYGADIPQRKAGSGMRTVWPNSKKTDPLNTRTEVPPSFSEHFAPHSLASSVAEARQHATLRAGSKDKDKAVTATATSKAGGSSPSVESVGESSSMTAPLNLTLPAPRQQEATSATTDAVSHPLVPESAGTPPSAAASSTSQLPVSHGIEEVPVFSVLSPREFRPGKKLVRTLRSSKDHLWGLIGDFSSNPASSSSSSLGTAAGSGPRSQSAPRSSVRGRNDGTPSTADLHQLEQAAARSGQRSGLSRRGPDATASSLLADVGKKLVGKRSLAKSVFQELDTHKQGVLSRTAFQTGLSALKVKLPEKEFATVAEAFDRGNGRLDYGQFVETVQEAAIADAAGRSQSAPRTRRVVEYRPDGQYNSGVRVSSGEILRHDLREENPKIFQSKGRVLQQLVERDRPRAKKLFEAALIDNGNITAQMATPGKLFDTKRRKDQLYADHISHVISSNPLKDGKQPPSETAVFSVQGSPTGKIKRSSGAASSKAASNNRPVDIYSKEYEDLVIQSRAAYRNTMTSDIFNTSPVVPARNPRSKSAPRQRAEYRSHSIVAESPMRLRETPEILSLSKLIPSEAPAGKRTFYGQQRQSTNVLTWN